MASAAADHGDEDADVIWEGSPLHAHMVSEGVTSPDGDVAPAAVDENKDLVAEEKEPKLRRKMRRTGVKASNKDVSVPSEWPKGVSNEHLEVEFAQKLLTSELLVQEDEDFLSNFILTDEALEAHHRRLKAIEGGDGRSRLADAILFTGSLAAVAGTVLYLSERTRLAATAAAVLPSAFAAIATLKTRGKAR